MKIRNKLTLSMGALSALILILGLLSVGSVRLLSKASHNILADNYNSLQYAQEMLSTLDSLPENSKAREHFLRNLALQELNLTEPDEIGITERLRDETEGLLNDTLPTLHKPAIRRALHEIMELNMASVQQKNETANETAASALLWILVCALSCLGVAFVLLVRLPRKVMQPISDLKEGITEIAGHNYEKRLDFSRNKEFRTVAESFNNMAEKLSEYRQSTLEDLMTSKKRIEAIVNSLHEPIIGLDPEKTVLFMNDEASTILNLKREAVTGRNATELALSNDLLRRLIRELYAEKKSGEPLKIYADDKESYFQMENIPLYIQPTGEKEKSFVGNVIILHNITHYKELDSAKTNFISTVSHEMKTPISSILMSLQLLEDSRLGNLNEEQKNLSENIRESSERLLGITGELLKMTQVETGKLMIMPKVTKPIELIDYAIGATRILAERFHCFVEVEYPEKISKLFVDSEKIAWVITNLLSNAIHHSPENARIVVGASEHDGRIEIYVQDFGRGIDPRYHQSIFERYFRVPGAKVQGSGLGLAISKEFMEAHGGTIRVESEPGKGSRFTLTFLDLL